MYKKGQKVQYQIDRGSSNALKPSTGTISKIQKKGNSYVYTVQDGGPVPVHELEIIALTEAKVNYNFSEDELKRVLKLLGRSASTEVKMIKAFEKAFGRKLTRDELFELVVTEAVYDNILKAVPDSYSYKNLATDIARMIKDEYGSHNIKPFTKELMKALKEGKLNEAAIPKLEKELEKVILKYMKDNVHTIPNIKQTVKLFPFSKFVKYYKTKKAAGLAEPQVEGKLNEASNLWKVFDAKMKLQDTIMDLEYDMKMINRDLSQLHKDMEQEAEPEGGPKATRYGKEIEKKEKEYKKKKAEFKKLMAKLDKMEMY